jgi:DNA-directed RNA polymerase specialized sigma24 family protein
MPSANSNDVLLCKNDEDDITTFLEQHEAYIRAQARRLVPRNMFAPEVIDLETDELVQKSRIKLWQALQERVITNPRAYIKAVVRSEAVNTTRQHRPLLPRPVDADGELRQEGAIGRSGEDTQDPAMIFEQKEQMVEQTARAVHSTLTLPQCQQRAMICALKKDVDDVQLLAREFKRQGVNIEAIHWPRDRVAAHRSKASLAPARRKLCRLMKYADPR